VDNSGGDVRWMRADVRGKRGEGKVRGMMAEV